MVSPKEKHFADLTQKQNKLGGVGEVDTDSLQIASWEAEEGKNLETGSCSEGRGFVDSPTPPSSPFSQSAVLRLRSDGEKPTRENPV